MKKIRKFKEVKSESERIDKTEENMRTFREKRTRTHADTLLTFKTVSS